MVLSEEVKGKPDSCTSNVILVLERDISILFIEFSAHPFTICNKKETKTKTKTHLTCLEHFPFFHIKTN